MWPVVFSNTPCFLFAVWRNQETFKFGGKFLDFSLAWSLCFAIGQVWETFPKVALCLKTQTKAVFVNDKHLSDIMKCVARGVNFCVSWGWCSNVLLCNNNRYFVSGDLFDDLYTVGSYTWRIHSSVRASNSSFWIQQLDGFESHPPVDLVKRKVTMGTPLIKTW